MRSSMPNPGANRTRRNDSAAAAATVIASSPILRAAATANSPMRGSMRGGQQIFGIVAVYREMGGADPTAQSGLIDHPAHAFLDLDQRGGSKVGQYDQEAIAVGGNEIV